MPPRWSYEVGDTATIPTYAGPQAATLVAITEFGWCPGANTYTWYAEATCGLHTLAAGHHADACCPADPAVRQANYDRAAAHYRRHLQQYPIWRQRFAADPAYPVLPPSHYSWAHAQVLKAAQEVSDATQTDRPADPGAATAGPLCGVRGAPAGAELGDHLQPQPHQPPLDRV